MENTHEVLVFDKGDYITYRPANPVIHSIVVSKNPSANIIIKTNYLMLNSLGGQCHGLPEQIQQTLSCVAGIDKVDISSVGVSSGSCKFVITIGDDFNMESMLRGMADVKYPGDGSPLLSEDEIQQILTKQPKKELIRNPFGLGADSTAYCAR